VFLFKPNLLPHPMAASAEAQQQEANLEYVAITRAMDTFIWVEEPPKDSGQKPLRFEEEAG